MDKRVRNTSLYHSKQCGVVLEPRTDRTDYTVVCFKPKFHYADFHWNFPAGKVADTYHDSRGHKRWQIMKPGSFGESREVGVMEFGLYDANDCSRKFRVYWCELGMIYH